MVKGIWHFSSYDVKTKGFSLNTILIPVEECGRSSTNFRRAFLSSGKLLSWAPLHIPISAPTATLWGPVHMGLVSVSPQTQGRVECGKWEIPRQFGNRMRHNCKKSVSTFCLIGKISTLYQTPRISTKAFQYQFKNWLNF